MRYPEFADRFLAALHWETEQTGHDYHRAGDIIEKYNLDGKAQWISRIADEWEHFYFKDVSKVLGGYDGWSFRISGQGARKIEDDFPTDADLRDFLGVPSADIDELDELIAKLGPASDRLISTKDNQVQRQAVVQELATIRTTLAGSNELDPEEKADVIVSLTAAEELAEQSDTWFAGAMKYLVFDRVKKAFERTIEDAIRVAILSSLAILAAIIMALI